jgi:CobQ-like glutamine amidotransferase family enzyme
VALPQAGGVRVSAVVRLCHLYPDEMNIYADRGNIAVFRRRLEWRGMGLEVVECGLGAPVDPAAHDLIYLGGGQDRDQAVVADDLARTKGDAIRSAVEDGVAFLAVCGGYQLAGHGYTGTDGSRLPGIGLLDADTVAGDTRLIGDVLIEAHLDGMSHQVAGFENHAGRTELGAGATPLGTVVAGHGNDGASGHEGCTRLRAIGTYLHGPLLPRNPWLADRILGWAIEHRTGQAPVLEPLDDTLEDAAFAVAVGRARGDRRERLMGRRA